MSLTLKMARALVNATTTSDSSLEVIQSDGGATVGPKFTTAPRLLMKSIIIHESFVSTWASTCGQFTQITTKIIDSDNLVYG